MVRLRLKRGGKRKYPFYWIVAADARSKRDGKVIEKLGYYNPVAKGNAKELDVKEEKIIDWYMKGARATDTVYQLMKRAGVVQKIMTLRKEKKEAQA